jgi:hypothetical protein
MSNPSPLSSVQQELEKALKEVRVYLVNNGWGDHHGQTYMRRVQKHLLTASTILAALPQPEGLIAAVQELRKRLDQWDDKQSTIAALIAENNVWGAARAVAEYASQLSAASLPSGWQPQEGIEILDYQARSAAENRPCAGRPCVDEFPGMPSRWCSGCLIAALLKRLTLPLPPAPAGEGQKP